MLLELGVALALAGPVEDGAAQYEAGAFVEAEATWEEALGERPSTTLLYDLGLARYQQGDRAGAVAAWRRARALAPRDGDLTHNLAQARGELSGLPRPAPSPALWMELVTPPELGLLALLLLGAGGLGSWGRLRGHRRSWQVLWGVGGLLAALALHGAWLQHEHPVVTLVADAVVRDGPRIEASEVDQWPAGAELSLLDRQGHFARVQTGEDQTGWVIASLLE